MLPVPLAFASFLWRQNRSGICIVLGYVVLAAVISAVLPAYCSPDVATFAFSLVGIVALAFTSVFLLSIFTYTREGADVLARESCFPPRLFRLPVPTYSLVLRPMIRGADAAICWVVIKSPQPWLEVSKTASLWWPPFLAAAALAWIQALVWSPFGLRGLRVFFLSVLIVSLFFLAVFSSLSGVPEGWLVGAYVVLTLVAWAIGYAGARHARRGDAPNWEAIFFQPFWQLARLWPSRSAPFPTW